ncbi:MAG: alpha/beta hydrolase [Bacteroidota bacterium]
MAALFKSEAGKKEILGLYDQKLAALHIAHESVYVDTSFGQTHLIRTGDPHHPPLILVHGSNGCAPIALECYPNLSTRYQVFAVDVLAQPNRSAQTRLDMKGPDYGQWMHELMVALDLHEVVLAGFSFGGLIILKTLVHHGGRVKAAFLASPAYLVNGNPLRALWHIFIPMRRYMRTQRVKYVEQFLAALFTDRDAFAVQFLALVFLHFKMDFNPLPVLTAAEAQKINTPISLLAAKNDLLFPGAKMLKRARKLLPSLENTLLLETSKHVQNQAGNRVFENLILGRSTAS